MITFNIKGINAEIKIRERTDPTRVSRTASCAFPCCEYSCEGCNASADSGSGDERCMVGIVLRNVCAMAVMKMIVMIPLKFTFDRTVATRFGCMPGMSPVNVPSRIPASVWINILWC